MAELSEYEQVRQNNIERNEQFLREIGMDEITNELATRIRGERNTEASKRGVSKRKAPAFAEPARRSSRVTIDRLKNEDLTLLSAAERKMKEDELAAMIEAKAAASYSSTIAAEDGGRDDRWTRFSHEPISALPPYNQPDAEDEDEEEAANTLKTKSTIKTEKKNKEVDSVEYMEWGRPILSLLERYGNEDPNESRARVSVSKKAAKHSSSSSSSCSMKMGVAVTTSNYWKHVKALHVKPEDVAKVTENRITAVWIHPSEHKLIVAAGDKSGYFGLWDVDAQETTGAGVIAGTGRSLLYGDKYASTTGVGGVYKYRPHVGNLARIYSYPISPSRIHTVSYDGTVRMLDTEKASFVEQFCASEGLEDMWYTDACEFMSVHNNIHVGARTAGLGKGAETSAGTGGAAGGDSLLFVSRSDGFVSLIDFRVASTGRGKDNSKYAWTCDVGYKVQSVQHWPTDENLLLTAHAGKGTDGGGSGTAGTMNVWDIRKLGASGSGLSEPVVSFAGHSKSINAAYASPDGQYVLSVSQDNTIRCWHGMQDILRTGVSESGISNGKVKGKAKSNNNSVSVSFTSKAHDNHTGRWLSTFRPQWDPKHPHAFLLGSMSQPRCLELYDIIDSSSGNNKAAGGSGVSISSAVVLRGDGTLNSVVSRNAVHPTLNIIAAANSSGRVHVFRE